MAAKKYYAYLIPKENQSGVAENWVECEKIVKGKPNARYKGFLTREEAEVWLRQGADYGAKKPVEPGIYFDAGTGRGNGVEVSVTDENGKNLLEDILEKKVLNKYGKQLLGKEVTNNYGELLACKYALEIAMRRSIKNVFGDSKLVVDYWSRAFINVGEVNEETWDLAAEVAGLRREFESKGGVIRHVSGDDNPADLGFHR